MPRAGEPGKYAPLCTWLAALPAEQEEAVLTLAEIETIIGAPLPVGAGTPHFWSSAPQELRNWGPVGFHARLDYSTQRVHFTRVTP
jgi:hypothetical protein